MARGYGSVEIRHKPAWFMAAINITIKNWFMVMARLTAARDFLRHNQKISWEIAMTRIFYGYG
jgi:hypothetical protein